MALNLHHLKHFLAVAEELHFGRAAERLSMAQPPLSQSIRRLENLLGCELFVRNRRKVALTSAGVAFLVHARDIFDQLDEMKQAVLRANEAGVIRLSIAFTPTSLPQAVPAAMQAISAIAPDVKIRLFEAARADQIDRLLKGELDIGFFLTETPQYPGLDVRVVQRITPLAALPEGWREAAKDEIVLADLKDRPLILFPAELGPRYHGSILEALKGAGVEPKVAQVATFDVTRLKLTAAGMGASLISDMVAPHGYPGVALRRIADLPPDVGTELVMAWSRAAAPAARRLFLTAFQAVRDNFQQRSAAGDAAQAAGVKTSRAD